MSNPPIPVEQRVVLRDVSWDTYTALVDEAPRPGIRMAYDIGILEIMSPSLRHEAFSRSIGRLIETFTETLNVELDSTGSTTFRRADLQKGIEFDESYYSTRAELIRGKEELDLTVDPGPDLAIEVDISDTSMSKFSIYAALNVTEIWLYKGDKLTIYILGDDGEYTETQQSSVLPKMPVKLLSDWLDQIGSVSETQIVRSFRKWVVDNVATG